MWRNNKCQISLCSRNHKPETKSNFDNSFVHCTNLNSMEDFFVCLVMEFRQTIAFSAHHHHNNTQLMDENYAESLLIFSKRLIFFPLFFLLSDSFVCCAHLMFAFSFCLHPSVTLCRALSARYTR